jgi:hypothetical protein
MHRSWPLQLIFFDSGTEPLISFDALTGAPSSVLLHPEVLLKP